MNLTGVVTKIESGRGYSDGLSRVYVRVNEADGMYAEFRVPNTDMLELEQNVSVVMTPIGRPEMAVLNGK